MAFTSSNASVCAFAVHASNSVASTQAALAVLALDVLVVASTELVLSVASSSAEVLVDALAVSAIPALGLAVSSSTAFVT